MTRMPRHLMLKLSFLLALCAITVAAGAATSLGRLQLGVAFATSSRYVSLAELMLAAVLLLGLLRWQPRQDQAPGWIRRPRAGLFALMVGACIPIIFGQKYWTEAAPGYRDRWERAATAVIAKAPDVEAWQGLAAIGPMEFRWIDYLAEHRLSVFHSDTGLRLYRSIRNDWKKPLSEFQRTDGAWCKGSVDPGTGVPGQVPQWFLLGGYAFDAEDHDAVDAVLFTEPDGRLIGIARPMSERPDIEASAGLKHHGLKLHYIGYAQVDAGPVQAYAFRAKRPTLCRIG